MDINTKQVITDLLENNLAVKSNEMIVILTDDDKVSLAELFYRTALNLTDEVTLLRYPTAIKSGEEPSKIVSDIMKKADVVIVITEHSISHTKARKEATKHLTRVATMPGLSNEMLHKGALLADSLIIKNRGEKLKRLMDKGKHVEIHTNNYKLTFSIKDRISKVSSGLLINPGDSGNLPSGEVFLAPVEGTANGKIEIDGSIAGIGKLSSPIVLTIENGELIKATGTDGEKLMSILGEDQGRLLAELGIGINEQARFTGRILEDEKKLGTCHIAFGTNVNFGGTISADVHIDAVILKPIVLIDNLLIISEGNLHIDE